MRYFLNMIKETIKIVFPSYFFVKRKTNSKIFLCLFSIYIFFALGSSDKVFSENLPQTEITVKGRIILPAGELVPKEGLNVVLLKLVLNAEGQVTPVGPQGRVLADNRGNFQFLRVNPDYRAAYQLGTRVAGKLYSTKVFFFKAGKNQYQKDIKIPVTSTDINKLEISQVSLVIESGLSSVTLTEVISFYNSSPDRIDTRDHSIDYSLPKGLYNFKMIQSNSGPDIEHQIDDRMLIIKSVFPPGNTQIIFNYNLESLYGSLQIQREFNHSLDKVSVFTPSGQLKIKSAQLIFSGKQNIQEIDFLVWKAKATDSNILELKIINIPINSFEYIGIAVIILLLLFLSVIIFYRNRLMMRDPI